MNNGLLDRLNQLFLLVTSNCNARCLLCQYWKSKSKKYLSLPVQEKKILPFVYSSRVDIFSCEKPEEK